MKHMENTKDANYFLKLGNTDFVPGKAKFLYKLLGKSKVKELFGIKGLLSQRIERNIFLNNDYGKIFISRIDEDLGHIEVIVHSDSSADARQIFVIKVALEHIKNVVGILIDRYEMKNSCKA